MLQIQTFLPEKKIITNYWCDELLLINKNVILVVGLDEN